MHPEKRFAPERFEGKVAHTHNSIDYLPRQQFVLKAGDFFDAIGFGLSSGFSDMSEHNDMAIRASVS
jgi:hypothetical protein